MLAPGAFAAAERSDRRLLAAMVTGKPASPAEIRTVMEARGVAAADLVKLPVGGALDAWQKICTHSWACQ
jgi:hypothetical protein